MTATPQEIARDMVQAALRDTGDFAAPALVEAIAAAIERARRDALAEAYWPAPESVRVTVGCEIVDVAKLVSRQVAALLIAPNVDYLGCSTPYVLEKINSAIESLKWLKSVVGEHGKRRTRDIAGKGGRDE